MFCQTDCSLIRSNVIIELAYESRDTYERVIRDEKGHGIVAGVQESEGTVVGLVNKLVVGNPGRC